MATNDYKPFAYVGGANVMTQVDYEALTARSVGFSAGVAQSLQLNKVWRQSSVVSSAVAQFIVDTLGVDVLDNGDRDALTALLLQALQARTRKRLEADLQLYVNGTSGNDLNDGLSPGSAFATMQRAWGELFNKYDFNGHSADISVADGTYNNALYCVGTPVGVGPNSEIRFTGNIVTPSTCVISVTLADAIRVYNCAALTRFAGFRLAATGSYGTGSGSALAVSLAEARFNKLEFSTCGETHALSQRGGKILVESGDTYAIVGGAARHYDVLVGSEILTPGSTVTLTGTPAFSQAFCVAREGGIANVYSTTFSGAATGKRYDVYENGVIQTFGAGATYLPGNAAGTAATGGQYV